MTTNTNSLIISKTPLRLPIAGGGTDILEYYTTHNGGRWISAAISSYVYVVLKRRFEEESKFVYSETQYVNHPSQFNHPILRTVLTKYHLLQHIELVSIADLPANLGLGSSGAFTVGLLNALQTFLNKASMPKELAEEAYEIERVSLQRRIGKQDQYAAAFGGAHIYDVSSEGNVITAPINISALQEWLLLFYINRRSMSAAEAILYISPEDQENIGVIGAESIDALRNQNFVRYGDLMAKHWTIKSRTQPPHFSNLIDHAKHHGAISGKLCGAGQGGCILLVVPPEYRADVIKTMAITDAIHIPFSFEYSGSGVYL